MLQNNIGNSRRTAEYRDVGIFLTTRLVVALYCYGAPDGDLFFLDLLLVACQDPSLHALIAYLCLIRDARTAVKRTFQDCVIANRAIGWAVGFFDRSLF
jgi:hypothetical protein